MTASPTEIGAGLVRDLLRDQHPDLAELPLREVAGGWGNQMWRLGDELALRIQRMDTEPDHQLKERRWLPVLAPRLPLPVPVPVRSGVPSQRFPKLWTVMTWVPGQPLDHGSITRDEHAADSLAEFLRALHVAAPADAPADPGRGAHPQDCTDGFHQFFDAVDAGTIGADAAAIHALWADAAAAPAWDGPQSGRTATCIPRTSSSRRGPWPASSTSVTCSPATQQSTWPPPGCCFPRTRSHASSPPTRT